MPRKRQAASSQRTILMFWSCFSILLAEPRLLIGPEQSVGDRVELVGHVRHEGDRGVHTADLVDRCKVPFEQAIKDAGALRLEGKEYVVKDGDVIHFRFAV